MGAECIIKIVGSKVFGRGLCVPGGGNKGNITVLRDIRHFLFEVRLMRVVKKISLVIVNQTISRVFIFYSRYFCLNRNDRPSHYYNRKYNNKKII